MRSTLRRFDALRREVRAIVTLDDSEFC